MRTGIEQVIAVRDLDRVLRTLRGRGYRVIGPRLRDGAIVYDDVGSVDDLPRGWTDVQAPGTYHVTRRDDEALFGYAVGPHTWKRELFPPRQILWSAIRDGDVTFHVEEPPRPTERLAFLGVRACELAAIAVQDQVLLRGPAVDTVYAARREDVVLIAVNCTDPGGSCFCVSMGTGPRVGSGADLVLTEVVDPHDHRFVAEAHTELGRALLAEVDAQPADDGTVARAEAAVDRAAERMGRSLDAAGVHDLLLDNLDHPRWDDVAERCLTCGACTLVCPTCFCTQVEDVTDLDGSNAHRQRRWDSCFSFGFSHAGPGSVRESAQSRYRQWMTHKLATWIDQFGTSGCVGCGRCLTWCPVGIDITEEVAAIATQPMGPVDREPEGVT